MNQTTISIIDKELEAHISYLPAQVAEVMAYSALSGGKRLRGYMVLEIARLCGGEAGFVSARPLAAAIEMVHAYSLVHDDLPCMDDDELRRGKPSVHKRYGEWKAVLCGDALLTHAFTVITKATLHSAAAVDAVRVLSTASGASGMIDGQWRDSEDPVKPDAKSDDPKSDDRLEEILITYQKKTGALFTAAAELGVIGGNGSMQERREAAEFGRLFGLAFQLKDDLDDVKQDRLQNKQTAATLLGEQKTSELINKILAQLENNMFKGIFD